jgi:hypothetical protein
MMPKISFKSADRVIQPVGDFTITNLRETTLMTPISIQKPDSTMDYFSHRVPDSINDQWLFEFLPILSSRTKQVFALIDLGIPSTMRG